LNFVKPGELLDDIYRFNRYFGLKWYERFNPLLLKIFFFTSLITVLAITITANQDFDEINERSRELWKNRYIQMASTFTAEPQSEPDLPADISTPGGRLTPAQPAPETAEEARERQRRAIADQLSSEGLLAELSGQDPYSDLPLPDDFVAFNEDDIMIDAERAQSSGRLFSGNRRRGRNYDLGTLEDPVVTPFNYQLERRGNIMIEFTDELIGEKEEEPRGYRDPDEINRVVHRYRPMIEYCFSREARIVSGLRGYVKVKFSISYEGHVIPESIRILGSTIRNRSVEQCIKNYIKRWRNFEKLDSSMGIAQVVQKFIFN